MMRPRFSATVSHTPTLSLLGVCPALPLALHTDALGVKITLSSPNYSPRNAAAVVHALVEALNGREYDDIWFPRLEEVRNHLLHKFHALREYIYGRLWLDRCQQISGITHYSRTSSFAARAHRGPPLRAEDCYGLDLLHNKEEEFDYEYGEINSVVTRGLKSRVCLLGTTAALASLIAQCTFGHGMLRYVHHLDDNTMVIDAETQHENVIECVRRVTGACKMLKELHTLLLHRVDIKNKTDIRLIGSETSYNGINPVSTYSVEVQTIESKRRSIDRWTGVATDPVEGLGWCFLAPQAVLRLSLYHYLLAIVRKCAGTSLSTLMHSAIPYISAHPENASKPPRSFLRFDEAVDHYLLEHGHQCCRDLVRQFLTTGK